MTKYAIPACESSSGTYKTQAVRTGPRGAGGGCARGATDASAGAPGRIKTAAAAAGRRRRRRCGRSRAPAPSGCRARARRRREARRANRQRRRVGCGDVGLRVARAACIGGGPQRLAARRQPRRELVGDVAVVGRLVQPRLDVVHEGLHLGRGHVDGRVDGLQSRGPHGGAAGASLPMNRSKEGWTTASPAASRAGTATGGRSSTPRGLRARPECEHESPPAFVKKQNAKIPFAAKPTGHLITRCLIMCVCLCVCVFVRAMAGKGRAASSRKWRRRRS